LTDSQLHHDLQQLTNEIKDLPLEEEAIARLTGLVEDLEAHGAAESAPAHLLDNLKSQISSFESEHPTLTAVLNNILVSLSNMGV
jgi:hypothetical protein